MDYLAERRGRGCRRRRRRWTSSSTIRRASSLNSTVHQIRPLVLIRAVITDRGYACQRGGGGGARNLQTTWGATNTRESWHVGAKRTRAINEVQWSAARERLSFSWHLRPRASGKLFTRLSGWEEERDGAPGEREKWWEGGRRREEPRKRARKRQGPRDCVWEEGKDA